MFRLHLGIATAVPVAGVPEHAILETIVCVFDAATGLVPVSVAAPAAPFRLKLENEVVPILMLSPIVAPDATSAVI